MVNKENQLSNKRKGCGVLDFKYGKSHHKTYESKFILIIARTFSGKSFLTVNLLCTMDLNNKYKQVSVFEPLSALEVALGPAETLYTSDFYKTMKTALRPGGIICTQV